MKKCTLLILILGLIFIHMLSNPKRPVGQPAGASPSILRVGFRPLEEMKVINPQLGFGLAPVSTPKYNSPLTGTNLFPSERTIEEQRQRWSDEELIEEARVVLMTPLKAATVPEVKKRLQAIDYLNSAVMWKDNPAWSKAVGVAEEVLSVPELDESTPIAIRRATAGDKVELYEVLLDHAADKAQELLEKFDGQPTGKILRFAKGLHE